MTFTKESKFEKALISALSSKGWSDNIIRNPTEADLLKNWANILFENNSDIDRLNNVPLTQGEMQQIVEQITTLRTPLKLNGFINGKTVAIKRDNPDDTLHFGKEVSLKIYDRLEIAGGQSRYQIAQQPKFKSKTKILNDRRGDLILLINGMPLIHIELKRSGVAISQACHQVEHYARSGIFTGLFSLVQVFVAMNPDETVYFANPGPDGKFNKDFFFHWADFNNEPINNWNDIASVLLSIPMAHQLIGFYTVPDDTDGVLKVMRSYQYNAANAISDKVAKTDWKSKHALGGYIWHTTGSGKTMTSFKSAQLIANSKNADKVVFLMDRIELGTQSLKEYRGFSDDNEEVQATENTSVLVTKLKSPDPANTLIVTSIQKMSNINNEVDGLKAKDIEIMNKKRIVFIVDEAHRSTFGDMLIDIKNTFTSAIFFGFTGTPILEENQKILNTTSTVFGDELHRYSIADGIRDKNVLGFDPYKISTYKDLDLRRVIALENAKAKDETEAYSDPKKKVIFNKFMNDVKMAGYKDALDNYIYGIEDYLPTSQYERIEHQEKVIEDILENWIVLSQANKFHAIFATSSINEAIDYYRLIKRVKPELKITALFDPNIENQGGAAFKEDGLVEIIEDYNSRYEQDFTLATHAKFKKDIASRLSHKEPYLRIENNPEKQIDILIVVNQMLTGFDSKWINTLYLDKLIEYENIIQAFSRTNRLFGPDKPFGTIRYYRKPHTMERNINAAVKLYSGDKPVDIFVEHLDQNLNALNAVFKDIEQLFVKSGVQNFEKLPSGVPERGKFAKLFSLLNFILEAAKIQGFKWSQSKYKFVKNGGNIEIDVALDEKTYLILALRYKELYNGGSSGGSGTSVVPYEIEGHLIQIKTDKIDADYMNSRFEKYIITLRKTGVDPIQLQSTLDELHKSFASLTQEEQKYANIFIHEVQKGTINIENGKSFREYITEYQYNAKNDQVKKVATILGLDEKQLRILMESNLNETNINQFGRFDSLKNTVDKEKAKVYFEKLEGKSIPPFKVNIKVQNLLQKFIIEGGFEVLG
jgi:type I restriction enzyme R subunit